MSKRRFKTAFILGAGLGMRLRPLTEQCPKPLLPIAGRPVITFAVDHLIGVGVDRFIINTHHCPDVYDEVFPGRNWRGLPLIFRHEPVLLDTAGGLKNIEDLLADDEAILCYNGDILSDFPLRKLIEAHEQKRPQAEATLALRSSGPLLNVNLNGRGEVCDMRHILRDPGTGSYLFTGIYAVETSILAHVEQDRKESVVPVFIRRIRERPGSIIGAVIDEGRWYDIGSIAEYESLKDWKEDDDTP